MQLKSKSQWNALLVIILGMAAENDLLPISFKYF